MAEAAGAGSDPLLPHLHCTKQVAFDLAAGDTTYVLDVAAPFSQQQGASSSGVVAASGSNYTVKLFARDSLRMITKLDPFNGPICGLTFARTDPNLLWVASKDGTVAMYDMRTNQPALNLHVPGDEIPACLDVSCDDNYCAVGTDANREDVFIPIWEARNPERPLVNLGEAHSDDITQVTFSSTAPHLLATGSTDGLANVFDLQQDVEDEDDLLVHTINSDSSIAKLGFFGPDNDFLYCLTHTEDVCFWHAAAQDNDDDEVIAKFEDVRSSLLSAEGQPMDYLIDCQYEPQQQRVYLVCGTQQGGVHIFHVNVSHMTLAMSLPPAHSDIVRAVQWHHPSQTLVTCGEDALVCLWGPHAPETAVESLKEKPQVAKKLAAARKAGQPY